MEPERQPNAELVDLWTTSSDYRQQFQGDDEVQTILSLLDLERATSLADVGCGNGAFALAAARRYAQCRVWAFDALASAVDECGAQAAELGDRLRTSVARAESIPLSDAAVERVLCRSVLHHIPDAPAAYAEMARILRPGGRLLLQAPCNAWEPSFEAVLADLYMGIDDSHRRHYHTPGDIIGGLLDAGISLRQAQCWTYDFPHLNRSLADEVERRGAAERLRLRRIREDLWTVELYWVRIVGERF